MNRVWVRPLKRAEFQQMFEWFMTNPSHSAPDSEIFQYPGTFVLTAHDGKPIAHLPVQTVFMAESLARDPARDPKKVAIALKELVGHLAFLAASRAMGEIYFVGSDPQTNEFAKQIFEELPWKLYRLRISDLEKPDESVQKDSN